MKTINMLLGSYKDKYHYRATMVIALSLTIWFLFSNRTMIDALASIVISAGFEYMTINLMFKRSFYPLNMFIDEYIQRDSFAHKVIYFVYYVLIWGTAIYIIYKEWS